MVAVATSAVGAGVVAVRVGVRRTERPAAPPVERGGKKRHAALRQSSGAVCDGRRNLVGRGVLPYNDANQRTSCKEPRPGGDVGDLGHRGAAARGLVAVAVAGVESAGAATHAPRRQFRTPAASCHLATTVVGTVRGLRGRPSCASRLVGSAEPKFRPTRASRNACMVKFRRRGTRASMRPAAARPCPLA